MTQQQPRSQWTTGWVTAVLVAGAVAVVLAERSGLIAVWVPWWLIAVLTAVGAVFTGLWIVAQHAQTGRPGTWRVVFARTVAWLATGGWIILATLTGWTPVTVAAGGVLLVAGFGTHHLCQPPPPPPAGTATIEVGTPPAVRSWQATLRSVPSLKGVRVDGVNPWANPRDGEQVACTLPPGIVAGDLVGSTDAIQGARPLPNGCVVRVLPGAHQGAAILDVMLRDSLADPVVVPEDYTPVSINDSFPLTWTPRGEPLDICLREQSMVVGGAPGSGKTTLLHRAILWLARCVDALIWVVDLNGGGVADPWTGPWARNPRLVRRPVVDWIADSEAEAAVLLATAAAIARDRKTSPAARTRRQAANTTVTPVDAQFPAIIVLTDEGGEVRQAVSVLGQVAADGISRIAQIGRAEAVRAIMSVLRGTADLLDKAMRVQAPIRICLRMEEEDEYAHVLGKEPGRRVRLIHKGSGYTLRGTDFTPIFSRSSDLKLDAIERAAIALGPLRPALDERAQQVAAQVTPRMVIGGREPTEEMMAEPAMADTAAGRAYSGRWDRYSVKLAEMRGEPAPEPAAPRPAPPAAAPAPTAAPDSALGRFLAAAKVPEPAGTPKPAGTGTDLDLDDQDAVNTAAREILDNIDWSTVDAGPVRLTIPEHIIVILAMNPAGLTSAQIGMALASRGAECSRGYRHEALNKLLADPARIVRDGTTYKLADPDAA